MRPERWALLITLLLCFTLARLDASDYSSAWLGPLRDSLLEKRQRELRRQHTDPNIVIAGIEDATFDSGHFNRAVHAQVIKNLSKAGARVIFYDVEFDEARAPEVDQALCKSVEEANRCVLAAAYRKNATSLVAPALIPGLEKVIRLGRARRGLINIDSNAVQKEAMLMIIVDGEPFLSAATAIAAQLSHLSPSDVKLTADRLLVSPLSFPVNQSEENSGEQIIRTVRATTVYSPPVTGPDAGKNRGYTVVPYESLIDPASPVLASLAGRIVMIGDNRRGDADIISTPVGKMKGIEVHAQILDTILNGPWLENARPGTRLYWPDVVGGWLLCACLSQLLWRQRTPGRMLVVQLLFASLTLEGYQVLGERGYILNIPLLGAELLATFVACGVLRFALTSKALATLIPKEIAHQLMRTGKSEVVRKEATVIVTDIRGYTSLSESKTPRQILEMLNEYHTETVSIFERHQGSVLNYQGDAQIVLFGYPKKLKDPARSAVLAALETSEAIERLRKRWNLSEEQTFDVGAGVCTGLVVIGELGSSSMQAEYTVIGETVRRCHKVQSMSNKLHSNVLVDQQTVDACLVKPPLEQRGLTELDGLKEPVMLYGTPTSK